MSKFKYISYRECWIKIKDNLYIRIPEKLLTDGDSGPFIVDQCIVTSTTHDIIYSKDPITVCDDSLHKHTIDISRKTADKIYRHLNNFIDTGIRFYGLRLFGWMYWRKGYLAYVNTEIESKLRKCSHNPQCFIEENGKLVKADYLYYKI